MKIILILITLATFFLTANVQKYVDPGKLEIRGYKIGQKVDTTLFLKQGDLYFPNYLDGWNYENFDQLPEKYSGLPIAIWLLKTDSAIALTLLNDKILNITVSYIDEDEKNAIVKEMNKRFGADGKVNNYEQNHPFQAWITYWNLKTWETEDVILQIGYSDMRKPEDPKPKDIKWNLVYSDFKIENEIINDFKNKNK